jgi:hypothetical protein
MQDDHLRQLKDEFDIAHRQGMSALQSGDDAGFGHSVDRENTIIAEQTKLIAARSDPAANPPHDDGIDELTHSRRVHIAG